ncbi:hypothetical protein N0V92_012758 [Colletotrichum tropicale]|nr:hypothetical protein N0V92_012758 [Colletotrichum tropicale]
MAPTGASSISELYKSYKKLTNCFLSWLWCQHRLKAPSGCSLNFRSTIDILKTAKVLQKAKTTVPTSVIGFLRSAIDKRKLVAGIYQHFGAGHDGHDALEEVLFILTPLVEVLPAPLMDTPDAEDLASYNRFSHLPTVESEPDDQSTPVETGHKHSGSPLSFSHTTNQANQSEPPSDFYLEDDYIREVFDAAYFLMELDRVHALLKKCWADASRGKMPFPLAAWMTNFAMYSIGKEMPPKFVSVCVNMSLYPESTCDFFSQLSDNVDPKVFVSDARRFFMLAQAVNDYGKTLCDAPKLNIRGKCSMNDNPNCECKFRTSYDAIPDGGLKGEELSKSETAAVRSIFEIIRADLETKRAISQLEVLKIRKCGCYTTVCESFFVMAEWFFSQSLPLATSRLVAGLNLYFLTDESVMTSDSKIPRSHYRLKSLRLAIDVRKSVLPVLEIVKVMVPNCERAKAWQAVLQELHDRLTAYISEKKFDIYHTSPMVAGSHMMEMLAAVYDKGLLINSDWATISATLHLYNAMRRTVAATHRIPVLEDLSQVLISSIFGGNLPERNFCSTFRRIAYHSKIEKEDGPRGKPKVFRLQAGFVQLPQLMDFKSNLFDQHILNHDDNLLFRAFVLGVPYQPAFRQKSYHKIKDARYKLTLSEYMEQAMGKVHLEIDGPEPISRINLFAVFTLCSKFLVKLGALGKPHLPTGIWPSDVGDQLKNDLVVGRCEAEALMESIDDYSGSKQGKRFLERTGPVRDAIKAFKEIDPETTLSQCMWDF